MKFNSVEVRGGTMYGYIELGLIVDQDNEKALGRALAEEMSQFPAKGLYIVSEKPSGISISVEVEADDFESLIDQAEKEQKRFEELVREAKCLRKMLCVIERASDYNMEGLPKIKKT